MEACFDAVVGCTDVKSHAQKPDPEGFITCVQCLGAVPGTGQYVYVGDHRDDVLFGKNAEKELGEPVVCICFDALRLNEEEHLGWDPAADFYVQDVKELREVLTELI
ncbi:MAG: HAD hydrolase-like protein [Lachnospiraceae bacterium]|nr:HAD hydrolase-like protein [Lachnospiraceae bacterium]